MQDSSFKVNNSSLLEHLERWAVWAETQLAEKTRVAQKIAAEKKASIEPQVA